MVGRVGDDVIGRRLVDNLSEAGVDTAAVLATAAVPSGVALIVVEHGGQNQIVVASGANGHLAPEDVAPVVEGTSGGLLLLQLESPMETVERAAALGRARGMTVVLDPAPARPLSDALLSRVDILTPNESEAAVLLGRPEGVLLDEAPGVARALLDRGPRSVVLKLGERGAFGHDGRDAWRVAGRSVHAVDATAAGDTFNGALAVALAEGRSMTDALTFANAAAAISVTRMGAQASIPHRGEVDTLLRGEGA
jgi:ribokinase